MMGQTGKPNFHRRSIRLPGYDYSTEGSYYITLVTHGREHLFGEIENGEMRLNEFGEIVNNTWDDLVNHINNIELDEFIVMPNHFHGIIVIYHPDDVVGAGSKPAPEDSRAGHGPAPTVGLPEIVRQFKTFSAKRINQKRGTTSQPVWQRNYYDHIIRSEKDYENNVNYIYLNPQNWGVKDEYYKS